MHRLNPHIPNQALPITIKSLYKIHDKLDFSKEDDVLFWAVVLVGFFLLLRKCNLVPNTGPNFDPSKQLKRSDLEMDQGHIKVTLRWTKNNQFTKEALRFILPTIPNSPLCPTSAVLSALHIASHCSNAGNSIFKCSNGTVYTYHNLQDKLAVLSEQLGEKRKFTSHSLRAGEATTAFLAGVPAEIIKVLGFWKSDCFLQYIRAPEQARFAAGLLMKRHILCLNAQV